MCIRDRAQTEPKRPRLHAVKSAPDLPQAVWVHLKAADRVCLLYTSDAADERSSVDLGGRRIIKKKKWNMLLA